MKKGPVFDCVQKTIHMPEMKRGVYLVTKNILQNIPEISGFKSGSLNLFLQHTSASITINENCCSDVRTDLEHWMNATVPESMHWDHSSEGPDDMPAHVKSSMIGVSLDIPIINGNLALGRWQGIYFNEHRSHGGSRTIIATIVGMRK